MLVHLLHARRNKCFSRSSPKGQLPLAHNVYPFSRLSEPALSNRRVGVALWNSCIDATSKNAALVVRVYAPTKNPTAKRKREAKSVHLVRVAHSLRYLARPVSIGAIGAIFVIPPHEADPLWGGILIFDPVLSGFFFKRSWSFKICEAFFGKTFFARKNLTPAPPNFFSHPSFWCMRGGLLAPSVYCLFSSVI